MKAITKLSYYLKKKEDYIQILKDEELLREIREAKNTNWIDFWWEWL